MILIIGSDGNMAARYKAIMNYASIPWCGVDKGVDVKEYLKSNHVDQILITTPTDTHFEIMKDVIPFKKHILVEKPVTKSVDELFELYDLCDSEKAPHFNMVMQYRYLLDEEQQRINIKEGDTESYYNYFKTGNDGLYWDCLQIIGLAADRVTIKNDSPRWRCCINGEVLSINTMDQAYINMITSWVVAPDIFSLRQFQEADSIISMHERVDMMIKRDFK